MAKNQPTGPTPQEQMEKEEHDKLRKELREMSSKIYDMQAEEKRLKERAIRIEEYEKKKEEQKHKEKEEIRKAEQEDTEKKEQSKLIEELKVQEKRRARMEKKRQSKEKAREEKRAKRIGFLGSEIVGGLKIELNAGTQFDLGGEKEEEQGKEFSDDDAFDDPEAEALRDKTAARLKRERRSKRERDKKREAEKIEKVREKQDTGITEAHARERSVPYSRLQALMKTIPTNRTQVFEHKIDWDKYDKHKSICEVPIARFVASKVQELLGQEEQTMAEYVMEQVAAHITAQEMYDDLYSVLDVDTEIFVLKLYRLIIFETEKLKL